LPERTFIDAVLKARLRTAPLLGRELVVQLTLDDADDPVGHVEWPEQVIV